VEAISGTDVVQEVESYFINGHGPYTGSRDSVLLGLLRDARSLRGGCSAGPRLPDVPDAGEPKALDGVGYLKPDS
jgi:hypothetical protein